MKKPPLRFTWCGEGAGAGTGALGAGTGALGAATGALGAATGALGAATGALGAGTKAGLAATGAGAGILCLALAAEPKVCASSKKVLPPAMVLAGMFGMAMGTKGLVVVGLRVGMESLGAAAAPEDWIGVKGDENLG